MRDDVLEKVRAWALAQPDVVVHTYLGGRGQVEESLTYAALEARSAEVARGLGGGFGPHVLLCYPPGLDFIVAFYACLKAGVVAVPVYPPDLRGAVGEAFEQVSKTCGAKTALTTTAYERAIRLRGIFRHMSFVATDAALPAVRNSTEKKENDVAFLQFTSGSTSAPKGVVICRDNLSHNLGEIVRALEADQQTVCGSWLPQYHDMGLIGSYLGTAYCGGRGYHTSPVDFVRRPTSWVEMMAEFRVTHTQAPSFAFGLAARKYLTLASAPPLDLSCVRHAINAAEPVRASDVDAFLAAFPSFPREALRPTYGLAEHTVFVCTNGVKRLDCSTDELRAGRVVEKNGSTTTTTTTTTTLFGCGFPPESIELRVVSEGRGIGDGLVGEVWLRSPSMARGYYNIPDEESFCGTLDGSPGWLRTGDLGFVFEGELFICGRIKDLLIVRGKNVYPQDLEKTAEDASRGALRPGCSAAIPSDDGVELVVEAKDGSLGLGVARAVGEAVAREHGVRLARLVVAPARTVPKTTSGKIARRACKLKLAAGELPVLATFLEEEEEEDESPKKPLTRRSLLSDEDLASELEAIAAKVGKRDEVGRDEPLKNLGMDSMEGMHLLAEIEERLGVVVDPELLYDETLTLRHLAFVVKRGGSVSRPVVVDAAGVAADVARGGAAAATAVLDRKHTVARADIMTGQFSSKLVSPGCCSGTSWWRAAARAANPRRLKIAAASLLVVVAFVLYVAPPLLLLAPLIIVFMPPRIVDPAFSKRFVAELARSNMVVVDRDALRRPDTPKLLLAVVDATVLRGPSLAVTCDALVPDATVAIRKPSLSDVLALGPKLVPASRQRVASELFARRSILVVVAAEEEEEEEEPDLATIAASARATLVPVLVAPACHAVAAPLDDRDPAALAAKAKRAFEDLRARYAPPQ
ncbi:hypothetical protein CTAYLR_003598 [Chrysophaeum taylorii]|uniref:Carrier domain-containing protein n=1 Tax=Chrysophaeum taylorii TaxID=2483200 RepID=A0AAD7XQH6_9STRA|nr:hypothetical protein CTAYLR_003598 [Chrysophaeum taylorii]